MASTQIPADEATKAAVVAYAAERGISQTKALAELVGIATKGMLAVSKSVLNPTDFEIHEPRKMGEIELDVAGLYRLKLVALERSQSPAETLSAALDALARPAAPVLSPAIVQPAEKLVRTWCGCDGEDGPGPWHRLGCERRTA
jgi:hypothetical protein